MQVYEAMAVEAQYKSKGKQVGKDAWIGNLISDELIIEYPLGAEGRKHIGFTDAGVSVEVECKGEFQEVLPLLLGPEDELTLRKRSAILKNEKGTFRIVFKGAVAIAKSEVGTDLDGKRCVVVNASGSGSLSYVMSFYP